MKLRLLILIAFIGVTLIPVAFLGVWPQSKALQNEIDRVSDQHVLLARHLKLAMERYYRDSVSVFELLVSNAIRGRKLDGANRLMNNLSFWHVCIAKVSDGKVVHSLSPKTAPCPQVIPEMRLKMFKSVAKEGVTNLTGVLLNPKGNPTIYLLRQLGDLLAVGAINTDYLRKLGKAVSFGKRGHAAIVDQRGLVIAHPLDDWIQSRKDISKIPPVQRMIKGETGISKFYSPALKDDMIAGFTTVEGPGWGVMIPQPFAELEAKADSIQLFGLTVILGGFLVALGVAWFFTDYLIRPLAAMSIAARRFGEGDTSARAELRSKHAPFELRNLLNNFNEMADIIQQNYDELEERVLDRTNELASREAALSRSEQRFRGFAQATSDWYWEMDQNLRFSYFSERFSTVTGVGTKALLGKTREETGIPDVDEEQWRDHLNALREHRSFRNFTHSRKKADGQIVWLAISGIPYFDSDNNFKGYRGTGSDVTQRRDSEIALQRAKDELELRVEERTAELRESNALKTAILDTALDCVISIDHNGNIFEWNASADQTFGYSRDNVLGKQLSDLIVPPDQREAFNTGFKRYLETSESKIIGNRIETVGIRSSGEEFPIEMAVTAQEGEAGPVITAYLRDLTEMKKAEQRLQQAQKMEAVGQLTGGVAHDFNNLLGVILGNAEFLTDIVGSGNAETQAIMGAATRGAELTQRLLAFSRQQPLQATPFDLGALVTGMRDLLVRTLGAPIKIETVSDPDLWTASADPNQVENALLNLAINARDAMADGGTLTLECANVHLDEMFLTENPEVAVGDYVMLAVSDEGSGMSAEVRSRAFEPFFTTKDVGEGSGLGLSMIYGFAKQSRGHVTIYSEEGHGTTVKLYLPRAKAPAPEINVSAAPKMPLGNGEVVLIIEDNPDIRALAVRILVDLNYQTIDAPNAAAAQEALKKEGRIDLILSDVILPGGTSGPEFVEQALLSFPDIKVIFMSGYPAVIAERNSKVRSDQILLNKPFERRQLADVLHQVLG